MSISGTKKNKSAMKLSLMVALSLGTQALALYKSHFTAVNFGATNYMDAYNYAFSFSTFIFSLVTGGVMTVIIPSYVKKERHEVTDSFITIIYGAVLALVMAIFLFRRPLLSLLTVNSNMEGFAELVGEWLAITLLIQGITAFLAVTTAYYQSIDLFLTPKIILLLVNLGVTVMMLSGQIKSLHGFLLVQAGASVVNLVFDVAVSVAFGFRYRPRLHIKDDEVRNLLRLFLPILFTSGIYKLSTFIDTTIAAALPEGQLTILSYAVHVINMVNSIVIGNLTVYIYPRIIRQLDREDHRKYFWDYGILFHAIVVMIAACFFTVGRECTSIIFKGGKFLAEDADFLYRMVCIYIFGQQVNVVRDLIYRYFFAQRNTKTPVRNSILVSVTNISLSLILVQFIGIYGIILGTVLASLVSFSRITWQMKKFYGLGVRFTGVLWEAGKSLVAFALSVGVVWLLRTAVSFSSRLAAIGVFGVATVGVYLLTLLILRSKVFHVKLG